MCNISRGRIISKQYIENNKGQYPVYSSQTLNDGVIGNISTYDYDGEYITWTTDGAYAGTVFYRQGKFSITNICGLISLKENTNMNLKYLYYWLSINAKKYVKGGSGNPKLMSNEVEKIKIPLISIEKQNQIVEKLDKFESLIKDMKNGLPKLIDLEKKRYIYYREKLLTFKE